MRTSRTKQKLKNIIAKHWPRISLLLQDKIPSYVFKSFQNILLCRTEKLGCRVYRCPDCGKRFIVHHSCKDRFCSSCGTFKTDIWAAKTVYMLSSIAAKYVFLTFTITKPLEKLAKYNKKIVLNLLFKAAWYAVRSYCHKKDIIPGMIAQLQTAGRWLNWHPHIHIVLTFGGLLLDHSSWKNISLNAKSIGQRFKSKFLQLLRKEFKKKTLITNFKSYKQFNKFLDQQYKQHWQFDRSDPIGRVKAVILYISRYLLKPPISDTRIRWFNYKTVCFTFKDWQTHLKKDYCISMLEFFSRLIHHVPITSFHMTRNYGLFSSKSKTKLLPKVQQLLPPPYSVELFVKEPKKNFRERTKDKTGKDPLICPDCNTELLLEMVYVRNQLTVTFDELLSRLRDPPNKKSSSSN